MERQPESQFGTSLRGRILASVFYEPSTRTRFSFEAAMLRLGGQVLSAESAATGSSAAKGESLEDAVRIIGGYADLIVLRHPEVGAAARAARVSPVPVINAGDGAGHHPTQALLDLYTIRKECGRLKFGRTARSLALLLARYPGNELTLVSPDELRLGEDVRQELLRSGVSVRDERDLSSAVGGADVLYQTRIQRERFASLTEYERVRSISVVDPGLMRRLPEHAILMHPLPRLDEIDQAVDGDPRAAYFRQARNGLFVRMAVLHWLAMGK
jgi:aspartate carbamoyltransferase catalytic subunit